MQPLEHFTHAFKTNVAAVGNNLFTTPNLSNTSILRPLEQQTGPPGTGKSTTVYHVIQSCVQPGHKTLVTCARNQAIDAIVDKLGPLNPLVSDSP
jgi:AAA domain